MNIKGYSILLSIIGIATLYFISTLSQPVQIELQEIPNYENKKITTEGSVKDFYTTKYGNQIITIKNNNFSAVVFAETEIDIEPGDIIKTTGKVQKYQNTWEIIVDNNRQISILKKWENTSIPLWYLSQKPSKYLDINVNITGFVDSIFENHIRLTDNEGKYFLLVFFDTYNNKVYPGREVNIRGKFTYDKDNFRYILILSNEKHNITSTNKRQQNA